MTRCPNCRSYDVIKHGFNVFKNHKVQKYKCLSCKKYFCYENRLPKSEVSSEIVGLCFDLYLKGFSYRIIQQQIIEQFNIRVSHVTIYNWLQTYTKIIKKYTDKLKPKLSVVWQVDDTYIHFKSQKISNNIKEMEFWCWACIDTKTRFVLDMYLGLSHGRFDGMKHFHRIRSTIKQEPKVICTDGNPAYISCIRKYFPNAKHINIKAITIEPSSSFIERFNGTIKNRTKIMRGFDEFDPCQTTLTAFQIYYNFLRPHMGLKGKTPAQEAGIDLNLKNRWVSLIRNSLISC